LNRTEILDENIVRFHLNFQCVIWEKLLAFIGCAIYLPDPDYENGEKFFNLIDQNDDLIGTGPFILTEYTIDDQVVFDYNTEYHMDWGDDHIEQMIYLIVPDSITASIAMENHVNIDMHPPSFGIIPIFWKKSWEGITTSYMSLFQMVWNFILQTLKENRITITERLKK